MKSKQNVEEDSNRNRTIVNEWQYNSKTGELLNGHFLLFDFLLLFLTFRPLGILKFKLKTELYRLNEIIKKKRRKMACGDRDKSRI